MRAWRRGGTAFVLQPRKVFRFKAANPQRNGGTRDLQNRTDTAPIPALIVQFDYLEAGLVAVWMAVIGVQGQLPLHRHGALLPELFDRLIIKAVVAFIMDDPGQLAKLEPVIACFEAGQFFDHLCGHLLAPAGTGDFRVLGKEPESALLPEAPRQLPHGFRVRVGLHSPLGGSPIVKEDYGANHLIAPLDLIDKVELELGKIRQGFHPRCSPLSPLGGCGLPSDDPIRRSGSRSLGVACR